MTADRPRRIHVIGDQGAGKTTLARRIGDLTRGPIHHLDDLAVDPETGLERPPEALRAIAAAIAASPAWVTEGLHAGWTSALLEAADRVVWLDTVGRSGAAGRIAKRFISGAWSEARHRGWRGVFRFRAYVRHLGDLGRTLLRVARTGRVAMRNAGGSSSTDDLEALLRGSPERLVHCRSEADVEAFVASLADDGATGPGNGSQPDAAATEAPASAGSRTVLAGSIRRGRGEILAHVRDPLFWHAYVLLANTAITSGLGVLYWLLVARLYPQAEVGRNATIIASITFVAGASQLNLRPVLARFVPVAGWRTGRLLAAAYAAAAAASLLLAVGYLAAGPLWISDGPILEVRAQPLAVVGFAIAAALWTQFALQDGALIGFRATVLLAVENATFSVSKILLAVGFALAAVGGGVAIVASWVAPIAAAVAVISVITAVRLLPNQLARRRPAVNLPSGARIVRYAAGDYAGSLFALAFTSLVPVIVLNQAGAEASARFYIVWVITISIQLIPSQMLTSLVVDTARDPATFGAQGRRMLAAMLRVLLPIVAVLVVGAPIVLGLFGPSYAEETLLLRLLALSAIPFAVINLYIAFARIGTQAGRIVLVQGAIAITLLTLIQWLLPRAGLEGVGYAVIITYGGFAAILLATWLRPVWRPVVSPGTR